MSWRPAGYARMAGANVSGTDVCAATMALHASRPVIRAHGMLNRGRLLPPRALREARRPRRAQSCSEPLPHRGAGAV